jgi:hypothetical protein
MESHNAAELMLRCSIIDPEQSKRHVHHSKKGLQS